MLLDATHLTFGEIADRWAHENAAHPGALGRDQILKRLEGGLKNDEFDYTELTIWRAAYDKLEDIYIYGNWGRQDANWTPVTRDNLHYILFRVRDPITERILGGRLRISQKGFCQWCKKQKYSLPTFWLDVANSDALSQTSDQLSGQKTKPQVARQLNKETDAKLKNRIKSVLATARRQWPNIKKRPDTSAMARELARIIHGGP